MATVFVIFHTAYMLLCYCQHSGVDLVGLKPGARFTKHPKMILDDLRIKL